MEGGGREERFRALYESARSRLLAYALRRTLTPEDAADVAAETFTIAWRRIDDLPAGEASVLWLYATARRVIANHGRRVQHRADVLERMRTEAAAAFNEQRGAVDEDAMVAALVLTRLSDDDREILMLAGWEGLDSVQLACVLGCSPLAARIRLHRARSRLVAELAVLGIGSKHERDSRHVRPRGVVSEGVPEEA